MQSRGARLACEAVVARANGEAGAMSGRALLCEEVDVDT